MTKRAPKYETIKNYLIQGISTRNFTDAVPSENQLAEKFRVSRMTARRALDELERNGSVKRIPGKGTFVRAGERYTRGFFRVRPFRKWAEDLKADLTTKVLESRITSAPEEIAAKLQYDGQVILLRILNFLDGKPVRYAVRYLRADLCAGVLWEDLENKSIHDILINTYRLPLSKIKQSMTAIALPAELSPLFDVPAGYPVFFFQRLTYSLERPITYVEYYLRGDMAFKDTFVPHLERSDFSSPSHH
jgi:GntR family transcriptional regulator